ncbi:MAG: hypothetical protein E7Z85_03960 [Methanosphaera stadtmanae]|nr:hypothetical protein [Methanosphaera stadtmanae]
MNSEKLTEGINFIKDTENPYYRILLPDTLQYLKCGEITDKEIKNINISKILKEEYPDICKSVKENNYNISENDECFYYFAIPDNDENIVGFVTFDIESEELLSLTHIYVIPEARGNNNFLQVLDYFNKNIDGFIALKNPNRSLMEILLKTDICSTIANRFALSTVPIIFNIVPWNESINGVYEYNSELDQSNEKIAMTTVYDTKLSAPILVNRSCITLDNLDDFKNQEYCLMAISRYDDNKEYDCVNARQEDSWIKSGKYFKKTLKLLNKSKLWL